MARAAQSRLNSRSLLKIAVGVLMLISILPTSWVRWITPLSGPLTIMMAPIQHPVHSMVSSIREPEGPAEPADARVAELQAQRDQYWQNWLQARGEIDDLRTQLKELSRGLELNPNLSIKQLIVPVIGGGLDPSSRAVKLKAGKADGVSEGDVAVVHGVHIVGRIARGVSDHNSTLLPITDASVKNPESLIGVIMLDDQVTGPICNLKPTRDGRLEGKVADVINSTGAGSTPPQVGMLVRLQDSAWPLSAQMLIIGQIEKVEPDLKNPLRPFVTVKPIYGHERRREVVVRIPDTSNAAPAAGGTVAPSTGGKR